MKTLLGFIAALALSVWSFAASATFVFSNLQLTSHSVSFTIDGDMTGYAPPATSGFEDQFSIRYSGGLWIGGANFSANTWSQSVFDNETLITNGNTGGFLTTFNYTWSIYASSLVDAVATNRSITVDWGNNYLDPLAIGSVAFVWGNGSDSSRHTVLEEFRVWNQGTVPEPATLAIFAFGLAGLGFSRRRR